MTKESGILSTSSLHYKIPIYDLHLMMVPILMSSTVWEFTQSDQTTTNSLSNFLYKASRDHLVQFLLIIIWGLMRCVSICDNYTSGCIMSYLLIRWRCSLQVSLASFEARGSQKMTDAIRSCSWHLIWSQVQVLSSLLVVYKVSQVEKGKKRLNKLWFHHLN